MEILEQIKKAVQKTLPEKCQVTKIEMEGPEIAIYTKNPRAFFENENFIANMAFELKKRVNLRTDKTLLMNPEEAKNKIMQIVPEDAQIKDISFNAAFSEVVVESIKPGLVIGKGGETSKKITLETGWIANIIRAPTQDSEILKGIRHHLHKYSDERKKILKETATKIYEEQKQGPTDWVRLIALGGFRQVGRSCMLLETPNTRVMLDCGINISNDSPGEAFPYLESLHFPLDQLDAVIISHAHMDHSGFLPYLFKLGYRGPVYCTPPTRDLMTLLQFDYIDVLVKERKEPPYSEKDVKEMVKFCIPREYREVTDIAPDMRLTLYNAAHIIGSASVHMHIGEGAHNLVYSGDIKNGFTRLFNNVDIKYPRLETLILESTYGGKDDIQPNRQDAEDKLLRVIKETIQKDGNTLVPVFSVGRAQEIMLVLENFYKKGLLDTKCFVDGMTREASAIHTAYPEYLREGVQRRVLQNDSPFTSEIFAPVEGKNRAEILQEKGAIIVASSGMLTGGPSLEYFYKMADNPNNTLIFVGYQGEGSLGKKIQGGVKTIPITENGKTKALNINMRIETVEGFSVPYETDLFVQKNGTFELLQIGKIADEFIPKNTEGIAELKNVFAPSFDENGKIALKEAAYVIKHKTNAEHLEIKTKSGRSAQASKGHSVFIIKEGEIKTVRTSELKKGDYIVIPKSLPESHTLTTVALTDFVSNQNYQVKQEVLKPKKGGNNKSFLRVKCDDMKSLAKFLGYYIAEGHIDKGKCNRPTLSFGMKEKDTLASDAVDCIKKAFGLNPTFAYPHSTEIQIRINSTILAEFLENIGVGIGAKNKRVPTIIYNLSAENQKEFLKAYFAGDGYDYKNGGKGYLAAKTASKQLVSDLAYLLLQHGITAHIKGPFVEKERILKGNKIKETTAYKIYFAEKNFQKINHPIGHLPFALPIKEINLENAIKLIKDPKLKKLAQYYIHNQKKKGRKLIGIELLNKMFPKEQRETQTKLKLLQKFLDGNLSVDEIIEIKEKEKPEFEYDLSVPGTENFVGGFGGIFLHNSGHSDKNQLVDYVRCLRPKPKRILVNHGEKNTAVEFARFISKKFRINASALRNLDAVRLK